MTDYAELVKRLRKLMMCEATMRAWDGWRKYIANGGGASWPRDSFESYLETRDEEAAEAADAIEALIRENEELDFLKWEGGEESIGREIEKAHARGYREGLEKAAGVTEKLMGKGWISSANAVADAIRALIPEDKTDGL